MERKKRSICWNITSRCNEYCKFCYRVMSKVENSYEENRKILELLVKSSVKEISWTGGEPLLYPRLKDLLMAAKSMGICNKILTNGKILTKELIIEMEPYLDYINLPYDSNNLNTYNEIGRGIEHGNKIIEILNFIREENININININTVISKINKNEIIDIGETLKKYKIGRWKLFKFMPLRNTAVDNGKIFEISDKEYEKTVEKVKQLYGKEINILECKEDQIQSDYLLIDPEGNFIITENLKDKKVFNIKNDDNLEELKNYL